MLSKDCKITLLPMVQGGLDAQKIEDISVIAPKAAGKKDEKRDGRLFLVLCHKAVNDKARGGVKAL